MGYLKIKFNPVALLGNIIGQLYLDVQDNIVGLILVKSICYLPHRGAHINLYAIEIYFGS